MTAALGLVKLLKGVSLAPTWRGCHPDFARNFLSLSFCCQWPPTSHNTHVVSWLKLMKVALDWLESTGVVMREAREVTMAPRSTLRSTPPSVDIRLPVLSSADTVLLLRINRTAGSPTVRQLRASDETPLSPLSPTEARQLESVLLENRQTMTLTPGRDIRESRQQTFSQQKMAGLWNQHRN